jgi:hypothetical protein
MLDNIATIKESINYLALLSPTISDQFLKSISYLIKENQDFRDSLLLNLRKGLFSKVLKHILSVIQNI